MRPNKLTPDWLKVPCPTCGVGADWVCMTLKLRKFMAVDFSRPTRYAHAARVAAGKKAASNRRRADNFRAGKPRGKLSERGARSAAIAWELRNKRLDTKGRRKAT